MHDDDNPRRWVTNSEEDDRDQEAEHGRCDPDIRQPVPVRTRGIFVRFQSPQCQCSKRRPRDAEHEDCPEFDQAEHAQHQRRNRKGIPRPHPVAISGGTNIILRRRSAKQWHRRKW